jgi:formylglycine-generating enzyme required for sulfatase activity
VAALLIASGAQAQISIDTVAVADPGNPPDTNGLGTVLRRFRIGTFEVTNRQYVTFLNAVAAGDPNGLYNELMTTSDRGGITRSGAPGSYTYQFKPNFEDKPVNAVSWYDAARFCNWLHHDQPTGPQGPGITEDGAYDMSAPGHLITRGFGARWYLPTHDEWYKTAYYDPIDPGADAGGTPDYWFYPTRSDVMPTKAEADEFGDVVNPGPNVANYDKGADWNDENGNVTTVGGCQALNRWGTFDLAGNINEMTETPGTPIPPNPPDQPDPLPTRRIRGGDFSNTGTLMGSPAFLAGSLNMLAEAANIGFRVARPDTQPADFNGDGIVGVEDFLQLLAVWGPCPGCPEDLDGDDTVGVLDFLALLAAWTP